MRQWDETTMRDQARRLGQTMAVEAGAFFQASRPSNKTRVAGNVPFADAFRHGSDERPATRSE